MPAPQPGAIQGMLYTSLAGFPMGQALPNYVTLLSTNLGTAWQAWMASLTWQGLTVTGVGIGAWVGVGSGGNLLQASPFQLPYTPYVKGTPFDQALQKGLAQSLQTNFTTWASTYVFASVPFMGSSGATPLTPGPFMANNTPMPLVGAGQGSPLDPGQIVNLWKPSLLQAGMKLTDPTNQFMQGVASGIVQTFQTLFLPVCMIQGGSAIGVAASGAGTGTGPSLPGVIV